MPRFWLTKKQQIIDACLFYFHGLAFLEVNEEMPFSQLAPEKREILDNLLTYWDGPYIANRNYTN